MRVGYPGVALPSGEGLLANVTLLACACWSGCLMCSANCNCTHVATIPSAALTCPHPQATNGFKIWIPLPAARPEGGEATQVSPARRIAQQREAAAAAAAGGCGTAGLSDVEMGGKPGDMNLQHLKLGEKVEGQGFQVGQSRV